MKKRKIKIVLSIIISIFCIINLIGCGMVDGYDTNSDKDNVVQEDTNNTDIPSNGNDNKTDEDTQQNSSTEDTNENTDTEDEPSLNDDTQEEESPVDVQPELQGDIIVKFIDVGQGDSSVIVTPNNDVILIDASDFANAEAVLNGLSEFEFEDIDLFILTHPDADHIRGAETIIETYDVNEVLMCSYVKTTKLFTSLLECLDTNDIKTTQAYVGQEYDIDGVHLQVVGVDSDTSSANNSSVVTNVTYGEVSLIFDGDAEKEAEEVILNNGFDLSAQVLKAGHHGSRTSTTEAFLDAVNPKIVIISCGEGNKYGHPHDETISKLNARGIQYYRTDEYGSITLEIDGVNIVTSFEEDVAMMSLMSNRSFFFEPNMAEIVVETEENVIAGLGLED